MENRRYTEEEACALVGATVMDPLKGPARGEVMGYGQYEGEVSEAGYFLLIDLSFPRKN